MKRSKTLLFLLISGLLSLVLIPATAMANPFEVGTYPTDGEFAPLFCGGEVAYDPVGDEQAGHRDIIGDADRPAALRAATDSHLYLRMRLDDTPQQGTRLKSFGWGYLFDVPPIGEENDDGVYSYDYLMHLEGSGSHDGILRFRSNEGQLEDNDPSAPAAGDLQWQLNHTEADPIWHVKVADGEPMNGANDYWLTVAIPWEVYLDLYGITPDSAPLMWMGTSTSNQSINIDFACHDGEFSGGLTLEDTASDPTPLDPETDPCGSQIDECSDNSECIDEGDGDYSCACEPGYVGEFCEEFEACSDDTTNECGEFSECIDEEDGDYSCACEPGYVGEFCEEFEACSDDTTNQCSENSECVDEEDGDYSCACEPGYVGDFCDEFEACSDDTTNQCSENSECVDEADGDYSCTCEPGFVGEFCEEFDPCSDDTTNQCSEFSECIDEADGDYSCTCEPGYFGEFCEEFDQCSDSDSNFCSDNSECINIVGGDYTCACEPGYVGDFCDEFEACSDDTTNQCSDNSECVDEEDGDYSCVCEPGYVGDYCDEFEACSDETTNECSENSECVDEEDGDYSCECEPGYVGDFCEDVALTLEVITPADGANLSTSTPIFSGTSTPGATVEIWVDGELLDSVVVDENGNWTYTATEALDDGTYDLVVVAARGDDEEEAQSQFTVDTLAPEISIEQPADSDILASSPEVITGETEPDTTVVIYIDGEEVGETTSDADGQWTFELEDELADGVHDIRAEATDEAGNVGADEITILVDSTAPVAITSPGNGDEVRTSTPVVEGTGEPGAEVIIYLNGEEVDTVTVDENGQWTWTPEEPLDDGEVTVEVESTSEHNVTTVDEVTFTVDTFTTGVVITTEDGLLTSDNQPSIEGTAQPNTNVEVFVDGELVATVTADENGNWSWTPDEALDDGEHVISARPEGRGDEDGDVITITVDTIPPELTVEQPEDRDPDSGTVTLEGTSEPGATIEVFVDGESVGTTTVDEDGNWSYDVPVDEDSEYDVEVTATDEAGNSTSRTVVVTTTPEYSEHPEYGFSGGGLGSCSTSSSLPGGGFILFAMGLVMLAVFRRRS